MTAGMPGGADERDDERAPGAGMPRGEPDADRAGAEPAPDASAGERGEDPGACRTGERTGPDRIRTEIAVRELLAAWGIAPDDPRTGRTAERVADAAAELLAGEGVDPVPALRDGRIPAPDGDLVLVRNIRFRSMCEHHLLPFDGWIQLAYLPGDWIVGFGRLHDLVETCASRLSLQERLGEQLVDALMLGLGARGALAVVEARQGCVADRGPRQADSDAVSVAARGALVDSAARAEAFRLIALAAVADRG